MSQQKPQYRAATHGGRRLRAAEGDRAARTRAGRGFRRLARSAQTVVLVVLLFSSAASAQAQPGYVSRADAIKAAYLYNFAKYVTWPQSQPAPETFRIGIVGKSAVNDRLSALVRDKSVRDMPIVVIGIENADAYQRCHILFLPAGHDHRVSAAILEKIGGSPTLVVGEESGFAAQGAMINFYLDDNNLKFEINPSAADTAGLTISSKLLSVGKVVRP